MDRPDHARTRRGARLAVRLILLALAVLFALGGPLPFWLRRVFPSLSPLSMIASAVSQRGAYAGIFWLAPPLVVLLLAFFKGRLFCRWICPAGTLFSLLSPRQPVARLCRRRWGGLFFWTILGGSLAGLPILLFLEPQPMLQRDLAWFGRALSLPAMIPGLVFPLFLALGAIQPMVWCTHFCPAGHCFDFLRNLRQSPAVAFNRDRRELLAGLFIGVPAAYAAARFPGVGSGAKPPVLPPGARNSGVFGAACHRCYACVDSCPTGVLRASFRPDRPLISWFQPEMQPDFGACEEFCNDCARVCPTGAIRNLGVEEKRQLQIGVAKVTRADCLAWTEGEHCMVCQEFCPYGAINTRTSRSGIPRPVVNEKKCRGCGFCQNACPAIRNGKAILVHGVDAQRKIG